MKKLIVFLTILFFVSGIQKIKAQDDVLNALDGQLTADESSKMERAKGHIKTATDLLKKAAEEDKKTEKYFTKKSSSAEKKAVPAKKFRIEAAVNYQKAYEIVYGIYLGRLQNCKYIFADDEQLANNLKIQADENFKNADSKQKPYKNQKDGDLKKVTYSKLKSDLTASVNLRTAGLKNLADAIVICQGQTDKKQKQEAEELKAWQAATSGNSTESFNNYLAKYPTGKYAQDAKTKIDEIKEAQRKAEEEARLKVQKSDDYGLVYKIQIAASPTKLNQSDLMRLYPNQSEIVEKVINNNYKYWVGSFRNYDEATTFKNNLRIYGAFIVAFIDSKPTDIKSALRAEKEKNK